MIKWNYEQIDLWTYSFEIKDEYGNSIYRIHLPVTFLTNNFSTCFKVSVILIQDELLTFFFTYCHWYEFVLKIRLHKEYNLIVVTNSQEVNIRSIIEFGLNSE